MSTILFDKPRSMSPDNLVRDLRTSPHCNGLEILLWDEEITIEETKTGLELTIKVDAARLEVEAGGGKKALAEKVAVALQAAGLRRRPPPGSGKFKKGPPRPSQPPPTAP